VHPGPNGERGVVKWTAPAAGTYTVAGRFQGIDTGATTSDVSITKNGTVLFSGNLNGYGTQLPFSLSVTVAAGDAIEFTVGVGANGTYNNDSTGLAATIVSQGGVANIEWLVSDQLGTPRMVVDSTGSLAGVRRHDYFPFGEEIPGDSSWRTAARGYAGDSVRQKFTDKERDSETGLDYFVARYYSSAQGRFTGPDSVGGSALNPQTLNLYAYVHNNPLKLTDPTGHMAVSEAEQHVHDHQFAQEARRAYYEEFYRQLDYQIMIASHMIKGDGDVNWSDGDSNTDNADNSNPDTEPTQVASLNELPQTSDEIVKAIIVVIWDPSHTPQDSYNALTWFGHVSFIFTQDDESYSWHGLKSWTIAKPSSRYTDERSKASAGIGIVLDFGSKLNEKFQNALKSAPESFLGINYPYHPTYNNCGEPFNVAINAIRKDIGVPKSKGTFPSEIKAYIEKNLGRYIIGHVEFPKH